VAFVQTFLSMGCPKTYFSGVSSVHLVDSNFHDDLAPADPLGTFISGFLISRFGRRTYALHDQLSVSLY